jgi:hypothetical protein
MSILAFAVSVASWIHVPGGTWQPTAELPAIRASLKPFVEQAAAEQKKRLPEWSTYTFQYQGQTKEHHNVVFINAFCSPARPDVKTQFVLVLDGGPCYFRATYDPARKAFVALEFNGDG